MVIEQVFIQRTTLFKLKWCVCSKYVHVLMLKFYITTSLFDKITCINTYYSNLNLLCYKLT